MNGIPALRAHFELICTVMNAAVADITHTESLRFFDGNTLEAFEFSGSIFGEDFAAVIRYRDIPENQMGPPTRNWTGSPTSAWRWAGTPSSWVPTTATSTGSRRSRRATM